MGTPVKPNPVHADSRAAAVANGQFSAGTVRSQLSGVIDLDQSGASNNLQLVKPDPALSQYQNYYLPAGPHKKLQAGPKSRSRKVSPASRKGKASTNAPKNKETTN